MNLISPWLVEGARLEYVLSSMSKDRGVSPEQLRTEMTQGTAFKRSVTEADVVITDTWVSMGKEAERSKRLDDLAPFNAGDFARAIAGIQA